MKKAHGRERKRSGEETKQRLLDAARVIFADRGYSGASVREVARRAGVSIGCLYLYFPNKQQLYTGLLQSQMDEFLARLNGLRTEKPEEALRKIIDLYMEIAVTKTKMLSTGIKEYDLEFRKPFRQTFIKAQHRFIVDIIDKGIRDGVFRPMDRNAAALVILTGLRGALLGYLTGDITQPKKYARKLHEIFLDGIRSHNHA